MITFSFRAGLSGRANADAALGAPFLGTTGAGGAAARLRAESIVPPAGGLGLAAAGPLIWGDAGAGEATLGRAAAIVGL